MVLHWLQFGIITCLMQNSNPSCNIANGTIEHYAWMPHFQPDAAAKSQWWTFQASPPWPWCLGHSTLHDECNFTTIEHYFFEAPAMANSLHWRKYLPQWQQRHETSCVGPLQMPHVTKNRINMSCCLNPCNSVQPAVLFYNSCSLNVKAPATGLD